MIYIPVSFLNKFTLHKDNADIQRPIPVSLFNDISNFTPFPLNTYYKKIF